KYTLGLGPNVPTALRALNDLDPRSSANCSGSNCVRAVGWVGTKPMFVDFDPASGFQVPHLVDCSAGLPGAVSPLFEGINNHDVAVGQWTDSNGNQRGLIAYPNVALPA